MLLWSCSQSGACLQDDDEDDDEDDEEKNIKKALKGGEVCCQ